MGNNWSKYAYLKKLKRGRIGGKQSQRVQSKNRVQRVACRPPDEMTHLTTMVIHRRLEGRLEQLDLFRGDRLNNYHLLINGGKWIYSISATELSIMLRKKWSMRWIVED